MPKLGKYAPVIDNVFFLYGTRKDAEEGINAQGTGFLVGVRVAEGHFYVHGVTNWHVAVKYLPSPYIRINKHSAEPEIFEFDASEWVFKPDSYDIAISPPLLIDPLLHKISFLDIDSFFLTPDQELQDEINAADEVFMVGLFVNYYGVEVSTPALRFGHISIMNAQIKQPTSYTGRSIILDMNSRTGFSGSPVFVFRTLGSHFLEPPQSGQFLMGGGHYMKLLGIHWGQFPERWELKNLPPEAAAEKASLIIDGKYVLGLSGMTCVIPASYILEVLNLPELQDMRTVENCYKA